MAEETRQKVRNKINKVQLTRQEFDSFKSKNGSEVIATTLIMQVKLPLILSIVGFANAGPGLYGICQTGCNALVVACYSAAGATFGTVTAGVGVAPAIIACNAALGTCMAGCVAAGFSPTP
ncbi:hypothetical protein FBU30_004990 [Linnemannia zychae]|nr:hypothetical protein FBU30_004990 [Linnemannia zychae]